MRRRAVNKLRVADYSDATASHGECGVCQRAMPDGARHCADPDYPDRCVEYVVTFETIKGVPVRTQDGMLVMHAQHVRTV